MKLKPSLISLTVAIGALPASGTESILANFDEPEAPEFRFTVPVEKADFDNDGDLEARIVGEGYQTIAKYRITRDVAAILLDETPLLTIEITAREDESTGNFLTMMPAVQTNATGEDIYEPTTNLKFHPWKTGENVFSIPLAEMKTKSVESMPDLLQSFAGGNGDYFFLVLVQQTAKGAQSVAYYDEIRLSQ